MGCGGEREEGERGGGRREATPRWLGACGHLPLLSVRDLRPYGFSLVFLFAE